MYSDIQKCILNFTGKKNIHLPPLTQTICIATEKYIPETIIFLFKSILFQLLLQHATLHTRATTRLFRPCKYSSEKKCFSQNLTKTCHHNLLMAHNSHCKNAKTSNLRNIRKFRNGIDKFTLFNGHPHYHILCLYAVIWKYRYQTSVQKTGRTSIINRLR